MTEYTSVSKLESCGGAARQNLKGHCANHGHGPLTISNTPVLFCGFNLLYFRGSIEMVRNIQVLRMTTKCYISAVFSKPWFMHHLRPGEELRFYVIAACWLQHQKIHAVLACYYVCVEPIQRVFINTYAHPVTHPQHGFPLHDLLLAPYHRHRWWASHAL